MKSRALILGAVVVIVAVGGGALGVRLMEKKTEQTVRDLLAENSATAETVDYSLLHNTLRLGGVRYALDLAGQHSDIMVDSARLEGFNPGCLDAAASEARLPLVAERMVMTGITGTGKSAKTESSFSLEEMHLEGWYQNLGKLAALYRQAPWSEAFFAEAYRYSLDMLAYKNYRATATMQGKAEPVVMTVGTMGLLGRAGSPDGNSDAGRTLSLFSNDSTFDLYGMASGTVRRVELHDLTLPDAAAMARLVPLLLAMDQAVGTPEAEKRQRDLENLLTEAYSTQAPYRELLLQDYVFQPQIGRPMHLGKLRNTLSMGTPFVFGLDITGLSGDLIALPTSVRRNLEAFSPDEPLVDGSVLLTLRPDGQDSTVQWSAGLQKMGAAQGGFDIRLAVKTLDVLPGMTQRQLMSAIQLTGGEATYTDQGLTALMLTIAAQNQGVTPKSMLDLLQAQLPSLAQGAGEVGPMLEKAAAAMLDKPGVVRVSFHSAKPLGLDQMLMMLLIDPAQLDVNVTAEPGPKALLDYIPEALRQ